MTGFPIWLVALVSCGRLSAPLPDLAGSDALAERIEILSDDCTEESCIWVYAMYYLGGLHSEYYDVPDSRFRVDYRCPVDTDPDFRPVLASTAALAQVGRECAEFAGNAFLVFPHWWDTECFFDQEYPDLGTVVFPDYVDDPAEFLYVACQPYSWAYKKRY